MRLPESWSLLVVVALACVACNGRGTPMDASNADSNVNAGGSTPGTLDVTPFVDAVDTNHDGCMNHAEWQAAGAPESSYQGLKDASGCVTASAMRAAAPPPGIDLNRDGKLTLEEMKEFDKRGRPGGPPPLQQASRR